MDKLALGHQPLDLDALLDVALRGRKLTLDPDAALRIDAIRARVDGLLHAEAPNVYGVNTGFGALAEVRIQASKLAELQRNLIRSHAAGVGLPFEASITRAMMLLRANVLMLGTSGTRSVVPRLLVEMLNAGVHPIIPEKGSVGASGDLAPLAHLALVLIGEGEALFRGRRMPGGEALRLAGLSPITLQAKEGLALINGTQAMTADAILTWDRSRSLTRFADVCGAAALDALLGTPRAFDARIHAARGHPGQLICAENLRRLLAGSDLVPSHHDCHKVQDPYSLRCMPQVHGATRDVLTYVEAVLSRECNAATDNPLVFTAAGPDAELDILSGGNFHGQPVAFAADFLGIAMAEMANISERRIEQLVNPTLSQGLPPFLAGDSGLNSGFMIAQVTAAALVSENKILAHPASVDSIPSSANREDHVSMGTIAARKARLIVENVENVLAIECLCAMQGLSLRRPLRSGPGIEAALECLREKVPRLTTDRILHPDIHAAAGLARSGRLLAAVEQAIGPLG